MLVQMNFDAKVITSFEKSFKDNSGKDIPYYNVSIMTDDGVASLKCNKDVHEAIKSQLVKPMQMCKCFAVVDVVSSKAVNKEFRVVGLSVEK